MSTGDTNRLEVLTRLCETAWTNFDRRRSYEWKLSLAIWAALTAFIALTLKGEVSKPPCLAFWLVAGLVVALQAFFLYRVKLANDPDQKAALAYEGELNNAIGEPSGWRAVELGRKEARKFWSGYWSFVVNIGITLVLVGAAGFVIYSNRNTAGEKNMSDPVSIFNVLIALAAIVSAIIAICVWRILKKTMIYQALVDVQKDYRSPQMLYAVDSLWQFYRKHGKENLADEYEKTRCEDNKKILGQGNQEDRIRALRNTLHYQRRLVSHFYQHLAALYVNKILPKDIVYKNWFEADLRIIPDILIPIENKLREVIHTPPLEPLDENCPLLVLYRDSKKR